VSHSVESQTTTRHTSQSTESGQEQIRLLHIVPSTSNGGDDKDITCVLFDSPPNIKNIAYVPLSYCWGDMSRQRTIQLAHHQLDKSEHDIISGVEGARMVELVLDLEIQPQPFNVTESLYQALKSLRDNFSHVWLRHSLLGRCTMYQSKRRQREEQTG
jgi:hypothetical protein